MRELSMHILDLAQNSVAAGAHRVDIEVSADTKADLLTVSITDDGKGMSKEFLEKVTDPFVTTRRTRSVGLGIPMMLQAARTCDGDMKVESEEGKGTKLTATFTLQHIDRVPLGDIASTMVTLVAANPDMEFRYIQRVDGKEFFFDTVDVKKHLEGVPINEAPVLRWIREFIEEHTSGEMMIS